MRGSGHKRRLGLLALSALGMAVAVAALLPSSAFAGSQALAADRQNYAAQPNGAPDEWSTYPTAFNASSPGPDAVDIHVGSAPQQATYESFLHLEIDAIPSNATITGLTLTLHPTDDQVRQGENVNAGTYTCPNGNSANCQQQPNDAVIDAYPLKAAYPQNFDPSNPPAPDTNGPEAVGKFNQADASWSFDLAPMVAYWQQHGNTGLAIVPDAAATTVTWQVGFYMAATSAKAAYTVGGGTGSGAGGVTLTYSGGGLPSVSLPAAAAQSVGAPPVAPAPLTAAPAAPAGRSTSRTAGATAAPAPSGMVPLWLLVLAVSTTGAVALLAQPVSQALAAAGGLGPALASQVKLHPRLVAVAGVLLIWSTTFGVYSNTLGRSLLSSASASTNGSGGAAASGPAGPGTGTAAAGQPGAAAGSAGSAGTEGSAAASSGAAYPNSPNPPSANLFQPSEETVGLTSNSIQLCAHAALTFGPAFSIGASDLNVFWQMVDDQGGVWGRKILQPNGSPGIPINDDGYQPTKAVVAAQNCQDQSGGDFFLLGGIGFDQIPAVRVWAEQHHMLYIHHIALQAGSEGLRYSFTMLPTLELVGQQYGQYYISQFAGKKIGIIERDSSNWSAGSATFKQTLQQAGFGNDIVADDTVQNNQGQYAQEIADMQANGAQVVLIWENALAALNIIKQANQQGYNPNWIGFPFNLTLYSANSAGVSPANLQKYSGLIPWPAYTCPSMRGSSSAYDPYMSEIKQFEAAYQKYDPSGYNNLCGDGGDLLFATWLAWKQVYDLLYQCGRDCTRDKIAGLMLSGYHATIGANCAVDFRGDGHHGGFLEDVYQVQVINGSPVWVSVPPYCRRTIS